MGEGPNAELVRRLYASFGKGVYEADVYDPDVEYVNPPDAVEPGVRRGREQMREALRSVREGFGDASITVERLQEAGDEVATRVSMDVRGPASGIQGAVPQSHLWTFRDGRVVRFEWSFDTEHAFEALRKRPEP